MDTAENTDWDAFWDMVGRHLPFLRFLYFVHLRKYFKLLSGVQIQNPQVLELGAGTGRISHELIRRYGGEATLVDSNPKAYALHRRLIPESKNITYLRTDLFALDLPPRFDIVMSDGLLEHFVDKAALLEAHKRFVKPDGFVIIFAVNKNLFTSFLGIGEKKIGCYSEPLSSKDFRLLCEANGLTITNLVSYFFEYGGLCRRNP